MTNDLEISFVNKTSRVVSIKVDIELHGEDVLRSNGWVSVPNNISKLEVRKIRIILEDYEE